MLIAIKKIFATWPFVLSLTALVVNDAWLKSAFPGFVSGKLSDVAGISVVTLLALAGKTRRSKLIYFTICVSFSWWKSSLSQGVIDFVNWFTFAPIGRTVDYTDLFALLIMPVCGYVARQPVRFEIPSRLLRRLIVFPVAATTALALMATSVIPTRHDLEIRQPGSSSLFGPASIAVAIEEIARKNGLHCDDCRDKEHYARYAGDGIFLEYQLNTSRTIVIKVEAFPAGLFFGPNGREKADKLRSSIKTHLAESFDGLEYVEQLKGK